MSRPIHVIAAEIQSDWKNVYFGAVPYLREMHFLSSIKDHCGCETADSVLLYFISNAKTWRGETARRIKAEINAMLKENR